MLAPIACALARAGRPFTFLALTTARAALSRFGIRSIGFSDLNEATDPEAQRWGRELAIPLTTGTAVPIEESIAYLGASFRDLVDECGEVEARRRYAEGGRQAFLPVATLRRFISRISPSLVIATNSPRAERAAILAAGQLGIPSVCAVDLFALKEVQWIGQAGYATRVCVLNENVRRMLLSHGRTQDEVIVTGNPAFDPLTAPETIEAGLKLRTQRGWDDGRKVILWASQVEPLKHPFANLAGDPNLPREVEATLRDFVKSNPGFHLVVRYHPSERVDFIGAPSVEFSPVSEPIASLLHAVDLVVVTASTVGLEASIAGRPVVSVDMSLFTSDTEYSKLGISYGVNSLQEIGPAVIKMVAKSRHELAGCSPSGSATSEVMKVIDSLSF